MGEQLRDLAWRAYGQVGARLGLYEKVSTSDGRYYYVRGPGLEFARFAVIAEGLEHEQDKWVKNWMSGEPAAVLWFSFWKLKMRARSKATFAEADWFRGFQVVLRRRR